MVECILTLASKNDADELTTPNKARSSPASRAMSAEASDRRVPRQTPNPASGYRSTRTRSVETRVPELMGDY